jgi:hypothetical protein
MSGWELNGTDSGSSPGNLIQLSSFVIRDDRIVLSGC